MTESKFTRMFRRDMDPKQVYYVAPSLECKYCNSEIPEFWANNCNACGMGTGDARIIYDASDLNAQYMVITDPDLIERMSKESGWVCTYPLGTSGSICEYVNDSGEEFCSNPICSGTLLTSGKTIPSRKIQNGQFSSASKAAGVIDYLESSANRSVSMKVSGTLPTNGRVQTHNLFNGSFKIVVTAAAVVVIGFGGYQWIHPVTMTGQVQSKHWETVVHVEKLTPSVHSDWSYPSNAYNVTTTTAVKSYNKVGAGTYHTETVTRYRNVSDGYTTEDCSETRGSLIVVKTCQVPKTKQESYTDSIQVEDIKQVPVEAPWYTYTVDEWRAEKDLPMIGNDSAIRFQDTILGYDQRSTTSCKASLSTTDQDGKTVNVGVDCNQFPTFQSGEQISFQHNKLGANWGPNHIDKK